MNAIAGRKSPEPAAGAPWYTQFWPVAIAVLMAISIAASIATVVIAVRHADQDVRTLPHDARSQ